MNTDAFLAQKGERTERALAEYIDAWRGVPDTLFEAARYSLFAGGKRLRPALALGAAEIICGSDDAALPAACAIEMIHTYSLIHDDLPAMDNDDLRRGRPTLHKAYGEAMAILAGDALLTMAFDVLAQTDNVRVLQEIARAAGAAGMVAGQVLDMQSENRRISLEELQRLHECKTGALIRISAWSGAALAGAREDQLEALSRFGSRLGLAFQIADDILDVTGNAETLGKPIGSDMANQKSTYPALVGLERARELAEEAVASALKSLEGFGPEADSFRNLARFVVERRR